MEVTFAPSKSWRLICGTFHIPTGAGRPGKFRPSLQLRPNEWRDSEAWDWWFAMGLGGKEVWKWNEMKWNDDDDDDYGDPFIYVLWRRYSVDMQWFESEGCVGIAYRRAGPSILKIIWATQNTLLLPLNPACLIRIQDPCNWCMINNPHITGVVFQWFCSIGTLGFSASRFSLKGPQAINPKNLRTEPPIEGNPHVVFEVLKNFSSHFSEGSVTMSLF